MIKRFYFLIVFSLCAVIASAQIQRKFLDFTLGVTTKAQVLNYIKSHHYEYHLIEDGDIGIHKIKFAGQNWPVAYFCFYNGKLYLVDFRDNDSFTSVETLNLTWKRLSNLLKQKYDNYSISSIEDGALDFSDNKTKLSSNYKYSLGGVSIHIMYYDIYLFGQMCESEESEL